ncbi:MAG TPA: hypothetical protein VLA43_15705, partial [Longimicrobiales bacterium]|nr:hypothetical protein [Longimicrobiales bacterium]
TPRHLDGFHQLTPEEADSALLLYRARLQALHRNHAGWEAHLFRNQGRDAGTSRSHPHAQLVGLPAPTPGRRELESRLHRAEREDGSCRVCVEATAAGAGERAVLRTQDFSVSTLYAPLDPFHLRIFPLRHGPSLAGAEYRETAALAELLRRLAGALEAAAPGVAWNLLCHDHGPAPHPALHWHMELRPRVGRTAGFELMTRVGVSPSDPVADAARLRTLLASHEPNPAAPNP